MTSAAGASLAASHGMGHRVHRSAAIVRPAPPVAGASGLPPTNVLIVEIADLPDRGSFPSTGRVYVGDWNKDERADVLFHGSNGKTWVDYARRGGQFEGTDWKRSDSRRGDQDWCHTTSRRKLFVGDFNGDGRDDLLCHQSNGK